TPDDVRRGAADLAFGADQAQTLSDFEACRGFDATHRLGEIKCPTLVVAGRHDRMVPPAHSEALAAGIAGARLVRLEAGHFPRQGQPEPSAEAVLPRVQALA